MTQRLEDEPMAEDALYRGMREDPDPMAGLV
jgi:hypothetical protein